MKFKHSLYLYQKDVLKIFDKEIEEGDKKIHIVAPPGSGKTIMGLEMISRLGGNHLILVPNITLQLQWKDKIEKFFLEEGENINDIVSITTSEIKKINILTYQSLTQTPKSNDLIFDKIIDIWFLDFKDDFKTRLDFNEYVEVLKDINPSDFSKNISKYKKKLKGQDNIKTDDLLSKKVLDYFRQLSTFGIKSIILDEAHHLTNWWSKSIYFLWDLLEEPYIIGLTATPPYDDIDFFILDDDYSKLLGEVDYYVPTPAIVKSGRLAPWSDLVLFVKPDDSLKEILHRNDKKLNNFLELNKNKIGKVLFKNIKENYDKLLAKHNKRLLSYLRFIKNYTNIDITEYFFDEKITENINLDDIAKGIGYYIHSLSLEIDDLDSKKIEKIKKLFYDLGYIWRGRSFYRFRTKIENLLIYGQSKLSGIKTILDKEKSNLGEDLKCAIITDFLEKKEGMVSCKYILENLLEYKDLNPILVSGQGIWKIGKYNEIVELDTNILEVTKLLELGKTKLIIGTRGILGEGWDCPKLNTLIDLTGIVAYMSVNQVRGRAIRQDSSNLKKVSNIYDIVTVFDGYSSLVDLSRLKRKHQKFYGVDDSGLIIKGIDHIYPNLFKRISEYEDINKNMLLRSENRDFYYKLWGVGGIYKNKEVFGLDLELNEIGRFIPLINYSLFDNIKLHKLFSSRDKLKNIIGVNFYKKIIYRFLLKFLKDISSTLEFSNNLPSDFKYKVILGEHGNYKIVSNYKCDLVIKKFMNEVSTVFKSTIDSKYVLKYPFAYFTGENVIKKYVIFGLTVSLSRNLSIREKFLYLIGKIKNGLGYIWFLEFLLLFDSLEYIYKLDLIYKITKGERPEFIYLNSAKIKRQDYIGKKPFIQSKIEKIWI